MRKLIGWGLALTGLAAATSASAASLDIRNAALRVVVIPEARSDVSVTVLKANPRLPLRVLTGPGGETVIDGDRLAGWFGWPPIVCEGAAPNAAVHVVGVGRVAYDDLPQVVVRVPMDAQVAAGGAVFGAISASNRLALDVSGCGEWTVGNVHDRLAVHNSGSAKVRTGMAGLMALRVSGSGLVSTRAAAGGLDAAVSGSGAVVVEQASGPIHARGSGSGDIQINGGRASVFDVRTSGSGDIAFKGAAEDVQAAITGSGQINAGAITRSLGVEISGSGDMTVREISGPIRAHISGSGDLKVAGGHASAVEAHLSGSGDVDLDGSADSVNASTSGSGDVHVAHVTGAVTSASSGSGRVTINR